MSISGVGLWRLFEQQKGGGIVTFITASSYLAGPGFVGVREVMRRTFDELWIINLGGDNLGPRKTENVFAIQNPVAIAIGVCGRPAHMNRPASVWYTTIEGTRSEKLIALGRISAFTDLIWQECSDRWQATFLPQGRGAYFDWPELPQIFRGSTPDQNTSEAGRLPKLQVYCENVGIRLLVVL